MSANSSSFKSFWLICPCFLLHQSNFTASIPSEGAIRGGMRGGESMVTGPSWLISLYPTPELSTAAIKLCSPSARTNFIHRTDHFPQRRCHASHESSQTEAVVRIHAVSTRRQIASCSHPQPEETHPFPSTTHLEPSKLFHSSQHLWKCLVTSCWKGHASRLIAGPSRPISSVPPAPREACWSSTVERRSFASRYPLSGPSGLSTPSSRVEVIAQ